MSVFWQVFLGVLAAWLVIQLIGNRVLAALYRRHTAALRIEGRELLAKAIAEELERRQRQ